MSTLVMARYQRLAITRVGNTWKVRLPMDDVWKKSSAYGTALTSEVVLSIEIVSLPVGGTTTRMAWGSTILRSVCMRDIPSADAASVCPSSTDRIPARMISDM